MQLGFMLNMAFVKQIHQIFFDFGDGRMLKDFPVFSASRAKFKVMGGWTYKLWDENMVDDVINEKCPRIFDE